jgi:hypothetical protein
LLLASLVIAQLIVDVVLGALVITCLLRRRPRRAPAPPPWYGELTQLAQDIVAVTRPVLDAADRRPAPAERGEPRSFHAGTAGDVPRPARLDASGRPGLLPGEQRLLAALAAATREG